MDEFGFPPQIFKWPSFDLAPGMEDLVLCEPGSWGRGFFASRYLDGYVYRCFRCGFNRCIYKEGDLYVVEGDDQGVSDAQPIVYGGSLELVERALLVEVGGLYRLVKGLPQVALPFRLDQINAGYKVVKAGRVRCSLGRLDGTFLPLVFLESGPPSYNIVKYSHVVDLPLPGLIESYKSETGAPFLQDYVVTPDRARSADVGTRNETCARIPGYRPGCRAQDAGGVDRRRLPPAVSKPCDTKANMRRSQMEEVSVNWAPNRGLIPGTEQLFTHLADFTAAFGDIVDRVGHPGGRFFEVQVNGRPLTIGQRAIDPRRAVEPLYRYRIVDLPPGWAIRAGTIAPALGGRGGGTQIQILDQLGGAKTALALVDKGVLVSWPTSR
ncbi:DUF4237 domain-containing protein [Buchananella hordeovulneris]|nr:DUF4237 domain-containing protein [Buchananella hordeovulneris]